MDENDDLMQTLLDLGLTEDQIEAIMGLGSVAQEQAGLPSRASMGERMYQSPTPPGRWSGRVYRHANPMEHAATALDRLAGVKTMYDTRRRGEELREEATRRRLALLNRMRSGRDQAGGSAMGYGAPMMPPPRGRGWV